MCHGYTPTPNVVGCYFFWVCRGVRSWIFLTGQGQAGATSSAPIIFCHFVRRICWLLPWCPTTPTWRQRMYAFSCFCLRLVWLRRSLCISTRMNKSVLLMFGHKKGYIGFLQTGRAVISVTPRVCYVHVYQRLATRRPNVFDTVSERLWRTSIVCHGLYGVIKIRHRFEGHYNTSFTVATDIRFYCELARLYVSCAGWFLVFRSYAYIHSSWSKMHLLFTQ